MHRLHKTERSVSMPFNLRRPLYRYNGKVKGKISRVWQHKLQIFKSAWDVSNMRYQLQLYSWSYLPSLRLRRRLFWTLFRRFLIFRTFSSQIGWIFRWFGYLVLSTDNIMSFFTEIIHFLCRNLTLSYILVPVFVISFLFISNFMLSGPVHNVEVRNLIRFSTSCSGVYRQKGHLDPFFRPINDHSTRNTWLATGGQSEPSYQPFISHKILSRLWARPFEFWGHVTSSVKLPLNLQCNIVSYIDGGHWSIGTMHLRLYLAWLLRYDVSILR